MAASGPVSKLNHGNHNADHGSHHGESRHHDSPQLDQDVPPQQLYPLHCARFQILEPDFLAGIKLLEPNTPRGVGR